MKRIFPILFMATSLISMTVVAQSKTTLKTKTKKQLYIDVHHLGAGKVSTADVAAAHKKDLAAEKQFGVSFIKYWVDTAKGDIYCLSSAPNAEAISHTHQVAHGLLPDETYLVTDGQAAKLKGSNNLYLDVHELGAGNVTAEAVAGAHKKDLAVEKKYGVNFINYWVIEKEGKVFCLSQAPDSSNVIKTHQEAHGLLPSYILTVKQGQ
jgi:hypothetical protein